MAKQNKHKGFNKRKQKRGNNDFHKSENSIKEKREQQKAERDAAIEKSKVKRLEKTKVISKKTKRGQPIMKDRIEYLLKKIQEFKK